MALLHAGLNWPLDDRHEAFFHWKHAENPCGPSPAWVALDGSQVVGLRIFLRWPFRRGGTAVPAVQAVDTVTHPDHQRRGIFSRLTTAALDVLRDEGVAFVFNTPNDASGPGYARMGWQTVGRFPVSILPGSVTALPRLARPGGAAGRWSLPTTSGVPAPGVVQDREGLERLLAAMPEDPRLRTHKTPPYLAWRYGHADLGYRAMLAGASVEDGLAFFRVRRRGQVLEAAVSDVLVPGNDRRLAARLVWRILRSSGADVVVGVATPGLPVPNRGPVMVWRGLGWTDMPPKHAWRLSAADLELF